MSALETTPWVRQSLKPDARAEIEAWANEHHVRIQIGRSRYGWTVRIYPARWGSAPLVEIFNGWGPMNAFRRACDAYEGKVTA